MDKLTLVSIRKSVKVENKGDRETFRNSKGEVFLLDGTLSLTDILGNESVGEYLSTLEKGSTLGVNVDHLVYTPGSKDFQDFFSSTEISYIINNFETLLKQGKLIIRNNEFFTLTL